MCIVCVCVGRWVHGCICVVMCVEKGKGSKWHVCRVRLREGEYFWKGMQMLTVNVAVL